MHIYFYDYPAGTLGIAESNNAITHVCYSNKTPSDFIIKETPLIKKAAGQLNEYFTGKRKAFDLPLELNGTGFQNAVWNALLAIPYGEMRSYKEIAEYIGNSRACRAVGMANHRNPLAIIVPCHRVVEHGGGLGGYAGGLDVKRYLLELESRVTPESAESPPNADKALLPP